MPRPAHLCFVFVAACVALPGCEERRAGGAGGAEDPEPSARPHRRAGAPEATSADGRRAGDPPQTSAAEGADAGPNPSNPDGTSEGAARSGTSARRAERGAEKGPSCDAIFVISQGHRLYAFDPRDNTFALRGTVDCPDATGASPFSMAVARNGIAHVLFNDGGIRAVDVTDARCEPTTFRRHQLPELELFGMTYAGNGNGESLFLGGFPNDGSSALAVVRSFPGDLERLGAIGLGGDAGMLELTATRDRLWGYVTSERQPRLVELDRRDGHILQSVPLDVGRGASGLALASFGGRFYIFTHVGSRDGVTTVTRYHPSTKATKVVAKTADMIVGAGASTCVPAS